jgi:hypothetical protein
MGVRRMKRVGVRVDEVRMVMMTMRMHVIMF